MNVSNKFTALLEPVGQVSRIDNQKLIKNV